MGHEPSAVASSPESWMKSGPMACALQADAVDVGGRVLDADDVLQLDSRAMVSTDMSITERGGML